MLFFFCFAAVTLVAVFVAVECEAEQRKQETKRRLILREILVVEGIISKQLAAVASKHQ